MGAGFIVFKNPMSTGSIRVGRTEEGTDSTRAEMADLLEVLIGANVNENLVVMVDNQSILQVGWRGGKNLLGIIGEPGHIADDHWTTVHEDCTGDSYVPM